MADARDQERAFGKVLARSLREGLDAGGKECPDAGLLAAYFERSLSSEEAHRWETHFTGCARCQEQLAVLARTELVAPARPSEQPAGWRRFWTLRWVAPLATAAAAFALWVAIKPAALQETAPLPSEAPAAGTTASSRVAPPTPANARQNLAAQAEEAQKARKADETAKLFARAARLAGDKDTAGARAAADQLRSLKEQSAKPGVEELKKHVTPAEDADKASGLAAGGVRAAAVPPPAQESEPRAGALDKREMPREPATPKAEIAEGRTTAPATQKEARPVVLEKTLTVAGAAPPTTRAESKEKARDDQAVLADRAAVGEKAAEPSVRAAAVAAEAAAGAPPARRDPAALMMGKVPHLEVEAPGERVRWRFNTLGAIEHSRDSGKTWRLQKNPAQAEMVAASAPSENVCWAVGRAGAILRTTDAGEHWEIIRSPTPQNLGKVKARDLQSAEIEAADGSKYITRNGGQSWEPK